MSDMKAADLPVGSVVANGILVGIKHDTEPRYGNPWQMSHGGRYHDAHIDDLLDKGAHVLRVGTEPAEDAAAKVYLVTSYLDGYEDSYTVWDVVATPELAEEWAAHFRRQDKDYEVTVEAWPVEALPPI